MASKITFTKRRAAAFTLIEVMVATGLAVLGVAAFVSYLEFSARSCNALDNYFDLNFKTQMAVDNMSKQIRQVQKLTACSTTNLTFKDNDGGVLQYNYSPVARALTRTKNGLTQTLLTGCNSFQFSLYQRTPLSNTFTAYSTSSTTNTKAIQISWTNCRSAGEGRTNTQGADSALVVIREK